MIYSQQMFWISNIGVAIVLYNKSNENLYYINIFISFICGCLYLISLFKTIYLIKLLKTWKRCVNKNCNIDYTIISAIHTLKRFHILWYSSSRRVFLLISISFKISFKAGKYISIYGFFFDNKVKLLINNFPFLISALYQKLQCVLTCSIN